MANKNIISAADSGDKMETLLALRHKIAETIHSSESGRDIAALSKQLREVMAEIEAARPEETTANTNVLQLVRKKHGKEA